MTAQREFRRWDRERIPRDTTAFVVSPMVSDSRLARMAREAPRIPWDKFVSNHFRWRNGEHVGLVGPTGQGKTTMILNLLPLHKYVTVFATKPRDRTMEGLIATGYLRMDKWRSLDPDEYPRRVLWPSANDLNSAVTQRAVFQS